MTITTSVPTAVELVEQLNAHADDPGFNAWAHVQASGCYDAAATNTLDPYVAELLIVLTDQTILQAEPDTVPFRWHVTDRRPTPAELLAAARTEQSDLIAARTEAAYLQANRDRLAVAALAAGATLDQVTDTLGLTEDEAVAIWADAHQHEAGVR